jgi:hypothetical protein
MYVIKKIKQILHHLYVVANRTTYLFHNSPKPSCRIWGSHSGSYEDKNKNKRNNCLNGTKLNSYTSKALNNPVLYVCH